MHLLLLKQLESSTPYDRAVALGQAYLVPVT